MGFALVRDLDREEYFRQTEGILEWLAEVGGLIRAFITIGQILVRPIANYHLNAMLAWLLVRVVPSSKKSLHGKKVKEKNQS